MAGRFRVLVLPAARAEMREAQAWYGQRAEGLDAQFLAELDAQMGRLADDPLRFPLVLDDVRRVHLKRFPYALLFRVRADTVSVMACFHARRDPLVWHGRR